MSCNYLITGAKGQLGSAFKSYINTRTDCASYSTNCNINDIDQLKSSLSNKFSTIINFAGIASVDACEQQPIDCYETNTIAVQKMLEILAGNDFRGKFINIGSINEFIPEKRLSVYSATKARAREMIEGFRLQGLDCQQYTIGLSISKYQTANMGTALRKIIAIASNCRDAAKEDKIEPVKVLNGSSKIRISSCSAMAKAIFEVSQNAEAVVDPYLDAEPIPFSCLIESVLDSADEISWTLDREGGYYGWPRGKKNGVPKLQRIVTPIAVTPHESHSGETIDLPSVNYLVPSSYHDVVRDITRDIISGKYPLKINA